jgi:hypothetical protein
MITKNEISSLNLSPTKKDFVQIWNELIEVASKITERWDPTSTNESDPGIVLLKVLTGIADKLNYNIDKNILEAFMPTAAQMDSMRKLCEMMGYDIKYYQSAETKVKIKYTGSEDERLPDTGLQLPKFTTVTNADKDITFVTTNAIPVFITNENPMVEVSCIEGQVSQCESVNENNLITLSQLDDEYRYYLPEIQIAENGIFVYNAQVRSNGTYEDGTPWEQVSNLNTRSTDTRVFKFGYDSFEGRPYLAFPDDVGSLIGDGLFIYFVRTSGINGNISHRTLEVIELPAGDGWDDHSAEQFEVINEDAATNGANIESISAAYNNFKKTVGTFDTLVTCRDYMNKIYSLMDASSAPYVSNILVTDIRNDINSAVTLCSCNEFGILYKETPLTEVIEGTNVTRKLDQIGPDTWQLNITQNDKGTEKPLIDHFDLVIYPFKTFTPVSYGTTDLIKPYNRAFTYYENMNREIAAACEEHKTCAHEFVTPKYGDVVAINNYLRLNALIATSNKVSEIEAESILQNIKVALINEFNMRNLDFGEEIPFDSILSIIENADSRIKIVSLQEPVVLTTYSVKAPNNYTADPPADPLVDYRATSEEYGIVSASGEKISGVKYLDKDGNEYRTEKGETAKDIYNKLTLRNILAGRAELFEYDTTFIANNSEKPYTVTKDITDKLIEDPNDNEAVKAIKTKIITAVNTLMDDPDTKVGEYLLYDRDDLITIGLNSSDSVLTLKVFDEDITERLKTIAADSANSAYTTADAIINKAWDTWKSQNGIPGEYEFDAQGLSNGKVKLIISETSEDSDDFTDLTQFAEYKGKTYSVLERVHKVYETYEPGFATSATSQEPAVATFARTRSQSNQTNSNIIDNISRVEAICEINGDNGAFENITLDKNEVIKFRAPNLVTTKTFPAYIYYRFEKALGSSTGSEGQSTKEGSYANCQELRSFITDVSTEKFLAKLKTVEGSNKAIQTFEAKNPNTTVFDQRDKTTEVFRTALFVWCENPPTGIEDIYIGSLSLIDAVGTYFTANPEADPIKFNYCPLVTDTLSVWEAAVKACDTNLSKYQTVLWKLSSTSSYPKGKLVLNNGRKLFAPNGDFLMNCTVGSDIYVCTDQGADPEYYTMSANSDIELQKGDKLYIHYTPSSTNEDGETVNAEPISIVYVGGDVDDAGNKKDPVILKPSGFTLMPTKDVLTQGVTPKKQVKFPGESEAKELLALGANEQIELRSIQKVVIDRPARFYKNFDNVQLEQGDANNTISYELKDGEYLFYTDKNAQDAAYYGSGSVITLVNGAYIPKASEQVEVSQILEQGLHIVPWSSYVALEPGKTVTVAEYQYITLVEGDTLNRLIVENSSKLSKNWLKCDQSELNGGPITYTPAGAESATTLPKIQLGQGSNIGWEVCSLLELSTSPNHAQQLRATSQTQKTTTATPATPAIVDKINVYTQTEVGGEQLAYSITPKETVLPGGLATAFEPVSVKLNVLAKTASGNLEKIEDSDDSEDTIQMKVFKEEAPSKIEFTNSDDTITPLSTKSSMSAEASSDNINNYLTKVDISELWRTVTEVEVKTDENGKEVQESKQVPRPNALKLNFMIPKDSDIFGVFSIYLDIPTAKVDPASNQNMLIKDSRVFIDIPGEFGIINKDTQNDFISIYNNNNKWWSEGISSNVDTDDDRTPNRLYLRAGLNCIKITKSCSLLIKSESGALGSILYDNLRLVKGLSKEGINLTRLDFQAVTEEQVQSESELAKAVLSGIQALDKHHDFYYNVPVENSLAIEFDDNINAFSNPYTLYDINNINNSFVISKLDVDYLDTGLKIAKSSRSSGYYGY